MQGKIEAGICGSHESRAERIRRVQFTTASLLVVPAGLLWGALFLMAGEPVASIPPLAYAVVTLAGVWLLPVTARFERFRLTQQAAIFVLPLAFQVVLDGFVGSGGAILWSFLAVLMATGLRSRMWTSQPAWRTPSRFFAPGSTPVALRWSAITVCRRVSPPPGARSTRSGRT